MTILQASSSQQSIFKSIGTVELKRFLEGNKPVPAAVPLVAFLGSPKLRTMWTIGGVRVTFKNAVLIGTPSIEEYKVEMVLKLTENGTVTLAETSRQTKFPKEGFFIEGELTVFDLEFFAPPVVRGGSSLNLEVTLQVVSENKASEITFKDIFERGFVYLNYTADFGGTYGRPQQSTAG